MCPHGLNKQIYKLEVLQDILKTIQCSPGGLTAAEVVGFLRKIR